MVTPYSALAIASLQQAALGFVAQFRNFIDGVNKQLQELSDKESEESLQLMQKHISDYDRQFKEAAIFLRKEMLSRLPVQEQKADDLILYNFPTNLLGMKQVADNVENLAEKLCPFK